MPRRRSSQGLDGMLGYSLAVKPVTALSGRIAEVA
jgi:hypothetical protein